MQSLTSFQLTNKLANIANNINYIGTVVILKILTENNIPSRFLPNKLSAGNFGSYLLASTMHGEMHGEMHGDW